MFFFGKRMAQCGHKTKMKGELQAFGESGIMTLPKEKTRPEYCLDCIAKMTIRCAWCGKPIFIGDAVTLYSPVDKNYEFPDYAVFHDKEKMQVVGCLSWGCAYTGGDRAGFWITPGIVNRVMTPWEILMANPKKMVIIQDVNNPTEQPFVGG
jgi:hypothetical protein